MITKLAIKSILKKVVLIVITFNRLETLQKNLDHIRVQERLPDFVMIVDNGSTDGTLPFLQNQNEFNYMSTGENLGFGAGLHFGIKHAMEKWNPDFFWLTDDDSFPNPAVLCSLLGAMEDHKISGILGMTGFRMEFGIPRSVSSDKTVESCDFVLVDNAIISSEVVKKAGNFSQDFFMMCEDYEFCLRLKKHGFFVGVFNSDTAKVERKHLGSQTNSKSLVWRGYYHSRNHLLILKDYFSLPSLFFYGYRQAKYLIHSALFGKNRWLRTKFRLLGIIDGFRNIKGKSISPITLKREG
ncbi:MAG: glycosyl transferase family 2 [Cyclobacterium sp.]|nr:glycosyl transferase family 2 [Cyclobacterium sp.]